MSLVQKTLVWVGGIIAVWSMIPTDNIDNKKIKTKNENLERIEIHQEENIENERSIPTNNSFNNKITETKKENIENIQTTNFSSISNADSGCNKNYSGCLKVNAWDYDCRWGSWNGPNYTGKVKVLWYDEYGLDRDNDGWGCE